MGLPPCFRAVNYGYNSCENMLHERIVECGVTTVADHHNMEELAQECLDLCQDREDCDFYSAFISGSDGLCTLKSIDSLLGSEHVQVVYGKKTPVDNRYCNDEQYMVPDQQYLEACGLQSVCAWRTDINYSATGAKNCGDWDLVDHCGNYSSTDDVKTQSDITDDETTGDGGGRNPLEITFLAIGSAVAGVVLIAAGAGAAIQSRYLKVGNAARTGKINKRVLIARRSSSGER